jgi:predicted Holliday junction resolvase-like endonuclease
VLLVVVCVVVAVAVEVMMVVNSDMVGVHERAAVCKRWLEEGARKRAREQKRVRVKRESTKGREREEGRKRERESARSYGILFTSPIYSQA